MKYFKSLVITITLFFTLAAFVAGQSMNARIFGQVKNEDGDGLAGVSVTVTNVETNAVTTTTTKKKGNFRILSLAPGTYQVTFDLKGYQTYSVSGVRLSSEQTATLRIKLKKEG